MTRRGWAPSALVLAEVAQGPLRCLLSRGPGAGPGETPECVFRTGLLGTLKRYLSNSGGIPSVLFVVSVVCGPTHMVTMEMPVSKACRRRWCTTVFI